MVDWARGKVGRAARLEMWMDIGLLSRAPRRININAPLGLRTVQRSSRRMGITRFLNGGARRLGISNAFRMRCLRLGRYRSLLLLPAPECVEPD